MVHGIVSLLDEENSELLLELWDELEEGCGLKGIRTTPLPHFSWYLAEEFDLPVLEERLRLIAGYLNPFAIQTVGLAIFTGMLPVVYLPIVSHPNLFSLHTHLWDVTSTLGQQLSPLYRPKHWVPHISLANKDVDNDSLQCIMKLFGEREFNWDIQIDNLAVISQEADQVGELKFNIPFIT